MYSGANEK
jgi:salicylate hydroxylase